MYYALWLVGGGGMVSDVLPGFYHPSLIGVNTDTNVLYDLIAVKLPEVCNSLTSLHLYLCPHTTVCVLILLHVSSCWYRQVWKSLTRLQLERESVCSDVC